MRTAFSFQSHTVITLDKVKLKLRACQRMLHPDKVTQQPARVRILAKKVYYALDYLKTKLEQDRYPARNQSANDKPKLDDYP